jgi:PUB domain
VQAPHNEKFWRVRRHNEAFLRSIGTVPSLESLLYAAGFVLEADDTWTWQCSQLSQAQGVREELERTLALSNMAH